MCRAPSCVRPQSPRSKFISDGLGFSSIASIMTCTPLSAKGFACNLQRDKKKNVITMLTILRIRKKKTAFFILTVNGDCNVERVSNGAVSS